MKKNIYIINTEEIYKIGLKDYVESHYNELSKNQLKGMICGFIRGLDCAVNDEDKNFVIRYCMAEIADGNYVGEKVDFKEVNEKGLLKYIKDTIT